MVDGGWVPALVWTWSRDFSASWLGSRIQRERERERGDCATSMHLCLHGSKGATSAARGSGRYTKCRPKHDNYPRYRPLFTAAYHLCIAKENAKVCMKYCCVSAAAELDLIGSDWTNCCLKHGSQQTTSARTGQTTALEW